MSSSFRIYASNYCNCKNVNAKASLRRPFWEWPPYKTGPKQQNKKKTYKTRSFLKIIQERAKKRGHI